jgi:hypothetical protein
MSDTGRRLGAIEEALRRQARVLDDHEDRLRLVERTFRVRRSQDVAETAEARSLARRDRRRQARLSGDRWS